MSSATIMATCSAIYMCVILFTFTVFPVVHGRNETTTATTATTITTPASNDSTSMTTGNHSITTGPSTKNGNTEGVSSSQSPAHFGSSGSTTSSDSAKGSGWETWMIVAAGAGFVLLVFAVPCVLCSICRKRKEQPTDRPISTVRFDAVRQKSLSESGVQILRRFGSSEENLDTAGTEFRRIDIDMGKDNLGADINTDDELNRCSSDAGRERSDIVIIHAEDTVKVNAAKFNSSGTLDTDVDVDVRYYDTENDSDHDMGYDRDDVACPECSKHGSSADDIEYAIDDGVKSAKLLTPQEFSDFEQAIMNASIENLVF